MAEWGDPWGEQWGNAIADIENHVEQANERKTYAFRNALNLAKIIAIHADRIQTLENASRGITPTLLFDIPTAYGQQLNQIGNIIGLPREGWDDVTYRIYLSTQALLILPERRTQARLLEVIRSLMNTTAGTIEYKEFRPKTYTIAVQGETLQTFLSWKRFIELCRPATYNAQILWISPFPFGYTDVTGVITPTQMYPYRDATNTIPGQGTYSAIV